MGVGGIAGRPPPGRSAAPGNPGFQAAIARSWARRSALADRRLERLALVLLAATYLYCLVGPSPFQHTTVNYTGDVSPVNRYVWLLLLGAGLPILLLRWSAVLRLAASCWPLLLAYGWFALTTTWALDHAASVRRFAVSVIGFAILAAITTGLRRTRPLHLILLAIGAAVVLVDVASAFVAPRLAMTTIGLAGMHSHKNDAGGVALYVLLVAGCYLPVAGGLAGRIGAGAAMLLCLVLLLLSRSETSILISVGVLPLLPLAVGLARRSALTISAVLLCLAVLCGTGFYLYLAWTGLTGRDPMAPLAGVTFTQRTDVWQFVLSEIAKRPLTGAGFGSFWDIDPTLQPSLFKGYWFASETEYTNEAHDGYLDILAATGWVGLLLVALVLLRTLGLSMLAIARAPSHGTAARSGEMTLGTAALHFGFTLALLVHNLMESTLFVANNPLGLFFLLSALHLEGWWLRQRRPAAAAEAQLRPAAALAAPRGGSGPPVVPGYPARPVP